MAEEEPSKGMIQPDPETAQRVGWILAALLFGLAIVSFIGEIRGWWGFVGEIGMLVGMIGGLFVSFLAYLQGAESRQVQAVQGAVEDTHRAVEDTHEAVEDNGATLASMDMKLDRLDQLDVIQAELDQQTGAMDRQIRVLEQIRDA